MSPTPLRRSLGVVDGVAIAASSTAAITGTGTGTSTSTIAPIVGLQGPALLLLAFLPVLGIATAYGWLNRSEPNCGNGYTWVGKTLGPWPGFPTGWLTIVGSVIFCAYTSAVMGSVVLVLANKAGLDTLAGITLDPTYTGVSTAVGLMLLLGLTALAVTGTRATTRFQFALLVFEYAVPTGFCGWALVTGDQSFSWFNRSWRLSGSESCCQVSCSAERPGRCWAFWLPAFASRPAPTDRVRGPGRRGRGSSRPGTSGPAWTVRAPPHHSGAVGADLVVLDRDPFTGPPADIAATRVLQTFVEGARVHAAPDAQGPRPRRRGPATVDAWGTAAPTPETRGTDAHRTLDDRRVTA